ncbi:alkaline phosphatase family protein [Natronorubrum halophilum]|uniref:alkaline phosphatase family protein n=1 Tax=Natronorubrum halophilum TaxID=1702106 RepID=UPI0010C1E9A9|nr:alkaline phosphatase family protein [Natronorubrum halophilum]
MTDSIVLGLDGATWEILNKLIKKDSLPNLKKVQSDGWTGDLESTFPPITAPAWLSMATGQNPGKTGVFYFLNRDVPDSFEFKPLGSDKFQGRCFWDVLAAHDQSVGIFNYPMLYPPYETDGFMVSGLGSEADDTITYPESLGGELDEVTDGYQVKVPYADPKYQGRPNVLERDLLDIIEKREQAIEYLLTEKDPDHFFGIISATDWAQHYFWRYYDDEHAMYEPSAGHEDALQRIWERVDETVGLVAEHAQKENANLLLVSDHGFGPVNRTFHSNVWLEQQGFSSPAEQSVVDQTRTKYFPYLRQVGEAVVRFVPQLNDFAKSVGKSIRSSPGDGIDFDQSVAFAPRQNLTCGMIYMLSEDPEDKQAVIDELNALVRREDGPESIDVYEPEDLYHGPKTDLAPDLLFKIDGFECAVDPRPATENNLFSDGSPSEARSGGHNQEGIFVATGPDIGTGDNVTATIYDIAPTVLCLHGTSIPEEMDGNVLGDLFEPGVSNDQEIETDSLENLTRSIRSPKREDNQEVQERLEDLGYI